MLSVWRHKPRTQPKLQQTRATVYVTHFPCNECAKELIQVGVRRVVYREPYVTASGLTQASIRMFNTVGVRYEAFQGETVAAEGRVALGRVSP